MTTELTILLIVFLLLAAAFMPRYGLLAIARTWRAARRRIRLEDMLKHALTLKLANQQASQQSVAGTLGISRARAIDLAQDASAAGLLHVSGEVLTLTDKGEELAMHILRAHRLWERYLADDAGMGLGDLHRAAEREEHRLTAERLSELADHLGHPATDPHGDPIPGTDGLATEGELSVLSDWAVGEPAQVVHVEDEPPAAMRKLLRRGIRPGRQLVVTAHDEGQIELELEGQPQTLAATLAANVHVQPAETLENLPRTLADLRRGEQARIHRISDACQGLTRRRLLDLGMTPGVAVKAELANTGRSAQAYRVRDTLIALRREQASLIYIEPNNREAAASHN